MESNVNRKKNIEEIHQSFEKCRRMLFNMNHIGLKTLPFTPAQGQVLFIIKHKGEMSLKDLADHLGVTSSAATQLVDSLVANELVTREVNQTDRRTVTIGLSEKSKSQFSAFKKEGMAQITNLFDVLSDTELSELNRLVNKISNQ
jgi:DNA-binding MarR family transcriptional regulator